MITSYRIFKTIHSAHWYDGEGAFRFGGRWNSRGLRVLYTAATLSLAALEMLVYLDDDDMMEEYSFAPVEFDSNLVTAVEAIDRVPPNWSGYPVPEAVRSIGGRWLRSGASAVLRVPTAIIPGEFNYLINLGHPEAKKIRMGGVSNFVFDKRLSRKIDPR